ncbi:MAG: hypothetical protein AB1847_02205 [bacterium]
MLKKSGIIIAFSFFFCLVISSFTLPGICAETGENSSVSRNANWYETQYGTSPFGGTWIMGQFGPDIGYGEQGVSYQYSDPLTGSYVSYMSTGMGMGLGGPFVGYGGMYSPVAAQSYGPYANGNNPQIQPTPGWSTKGYSSGNLFGQSTNYYQAQPALFGLGLYGLGGYGLGGYSSLGLYGLGGYGVSGLYYGTAGLYGLGGFSYPYI